ncbi:MAG: hypothetical protein WBN40_05445, partial [Pseudomonadales bacterium]
AYAASSSLGERSDYARAYDPAILHPIERKAYRATLDCPEQNVLPAMSGADYWHCFEVSWLSREGQPQFSHGRFQVNAGSSHIVESKSLKLYLNSLNQQHFDSADDLRRAVSGDLTAACGVAIEFEILDASRNMDGTPHKTNTQKKTGIQNISKAVLIDNRRVACNNYQRDAALLGQGEGQTEGEWLTSRLLRSNCPVTSQPDWAHLDIFYAGRKLDQDSLLQYIASYREHSGFHEQTIEQIYCDFSALQAIEAVAVLGRYTRRGGIAINVLRATPKFEQALIEQALTISFGQ